MAKFKSLLIGCRIVHAGRRRKCYHSPKHLILKGDIVLEAKNNMAWQGYCAECGAEMLQKAGVELDACSNDLLLGNDRP